MRSTFGVLAGEITAAFGVTDEGGLLLLHLGTAPFGKIDDYAEPVQYANFRAAEVQIAGHNHDEGHGTKNMGTSEGKTLRYVSHAERETEQGKLLEITLKNEYIESRLSYLFYRDCRAVRAVQSVTNIGARPLALEYVSSFMLYGLEKFGKNNYDDIELTVSYNSSYRENQWKTYRLADLGFVPSSRWSTVPHKVCFFNTGSWSTKQHLPAAYIFDRASGQYMLWEIASHGSWSWEIGDYNNNLYLGASGPNQTENGWCKTLDPGETFDAVPVSLAFSAEGTDDLFGQMTRLRRLTRRRHADSEKLFTVYNSYMHDSGENPTEEGQWRAIEGVKDLDLDYFCIDAGWHDEGDGYWKAIGDWKESRTRFPSGLAVTLDKIRAAGMKPGLWLEIQNMGFFNPNKDLLPVECYFTRSGGVISNNGRITMDFSHPLVIGRMDEIMDRIVREYDPGYIKFDYNADTGTGTDARGNAGEGLRRHAEGYAKWLSRLMDRYPDIVFENCNSGGLALDPVMLSLCSIHSTSDQTDYLRYPYIAGNMLSNGTPEQMAVWCYPLEGQDEEAVIMNVVNTLLGRIHLSGKTYLQTGANRALVSEGLSCHRRMAEDKRRALPFWPLGFNEYGGDKVAAGIRTEDKAYLCVWNLCEEARVIRLPLPFAAERAERGYPADFRGADFKLDSDGRALEVSFASRQARMIELKIKK